MIACVSSSAFGRLYRKIDCTAADIAALRKAIYGRRVSIPLGMHNLEEIVLAPSSSPQAIAARIRMLLSISSPRVLLKPCGHMIADDLRAFASGGETPGPFERGATQNAVNTGISELLESDGEELNEDFTAALFQVRREREAFVASLAEFIPDCAGRLPAAAAAGGFEEYYRNHGAAAVAHLATHAGIATGLPSGAADLTVAPPSIKMWAGAALSLVWARAVEREQTRDEDVIEAMHAVTGAGASAELFVTGEDRESRWISRIPVDGFSVSSLRDFLARTIKNSADGAE
jgi:hypothetical protein